LQSITGIAVRKPVEAVRNQGFDVAQLEWEFAGIYIYIYLYNIKEPGYDNRQSVGFNQLKRTQFDMFHVGICRDNMGL